VITKEIMRKIFACILYILACVWMIAPNQVYAKPPQFSLKGLYMNQLKDTLAVIGHSSPDTDSAVAAVTYSMLLNKIGVPATPFLAGQANEETKFVFKRFNVPLPDVLDNAEGKKVVLVDHNDFSQGVKGLDKADVWQVVDHHSVGDFKTKRPLYISFMPLGSASSVVYTYYVQDKVKIDKNTAGLLMSAILSDTLIMKSPTCTDLDRQVVKYLAKIAGVKDVEQYGLTMFKEGYNLDNKTDEELFYYDYKLFSTNGVTFAINQLMSVDDKVLDSLKERMAQYGSKVLGKRGEAMDFIVLTNVVTCNSKILGIGDGAKEICNKAFMCPDTETTWLRGVVSRKKQVLPALMKSL